MIALRWKDIDYRVRLVRVRRSFTRGELMLPKTAWSMRAVPLPTRLMQELENHHTRSRFQEPEDLVFPHPNRGTFLDASKLRRRFVVAAATAGLPVTRFHDLRHTYGTHMAAVGAPMRALQAWMGHGDHRTTSIYVDYAPDPEAHQRFADAAFGSGESHGNLLAHSPTEIAAHLPTRRSR